MLSIAAWNEANSSGGRKFGTTTQPSRSNWARRSAGTKRARRAVRDLASAWAARSRQTCKPRRLRRGEPRIGLSAKDFAPVARLASIENVMLVHPSVPAKTLKDFVALARANPGKLNYGSGGPGTTNHLANELLKSLEKLNMVHVPYKGATVATTALIGGEVDEVIVSVASVLSFIKAGKVRPLVVLSEKRVATLPEVPTSKEAGFPNFQMSIWYGMMAPAGTPREIVTRLYQEVAKALDDRTLRQHMANVGMDPWLGSPEEMGKLVRSEIGRYAKIIQSAGIKKDAL